MKERGAETVKPTILPNLKGVPETLLLSLHCRAVESERPDGMIHDPKAGEILRSLSYDFSGKALKDGDQVTTAMRARRFDLHVRRFLETSPSGCVIEIGCGLDGRFERLDNGRAAWFDLDLPPVIELRRAFFLETDRRRFLPASVLDFDWMTVVRRHPGPYLFVAEGVFPYFHEREVRRLVTGLRESFAGCELVFDANSALLVRLHNPKLARRHVAARLQWGLESPAGIEAWAVGLHLLDAWHYFEDREPRLGWMRLIRFIPPLARAASVLHYRLG